MTPNWEQIESDVQRAVGESSFASWFSTIKKTAVDGALVLETPDEFFKAWIEDHYRGQIEDILRRAFGEGCALSITVTETKQAPAHQEEGRGRPAESPSEPPEPLAARFSFDNFVVGPSNRFAFAACRAVAESPAKSYNPLFLYSQVGLGKTHLMQSVAQEIKARFPEKKCAFLSSEYFTNELIDAIKNRTTTQFRQKYRNIDVLLIDDIHFIAGKEATQEEFFHTFNTLHNDHKQIIISSDRHPKEIANLEGRLVSRFAWGLVADIQPPDFETRVAILRKKLEREPVSVPDDVLLFIAEQIKTNIRELEGALIRVVAYSLLEERPVSLEIAKTILKDMVTEKPKTVSPEDIQKEVALYFSVTVSDLKSKRRNKAVIIPRQIAMYLCRKITTLSLPELGVFFGGKDHTTVLHACRKIEKDLDIEPETRKAVEILLTKIKQ